MFFNKKKEVLPSEVAREKLHSDIKGILYDAYFPDVISDYKLLLYEDRTKVVVSVDGKRYSTKDDFYMAFISELENAMKSVIGSYKDKCNEIGCKPIQIDYWLTLNDRFVSHVDVRNINTQIIKWNMIFPYDKDSNTTVLEPTIF